LACRASRVILLGDCSGPVSSYLREIPHKEHEYLRIAEKGVFKDMKLEEIEKMIKLG
jgi:hypothetical protein